MSAPKLSLSPRSYQAQLRIQFPLKYPPIPSMTKTSVPTPRKNCPLLATATKTSTASSSSKLNANAKPFTPSATGPAQKLNPNAVAFTPSTSSPSSGKTTPVEAIGAATAAKVNTSSPTSSADKTTPVEAIGAASAAKVNTSSPSSNAGKTTPVDAIGTTGATSASTSATKGNTSSSTSPPSSSADKTTPVDAIGTTGATSASTSATKGNTSSSASSPSSNADKTTPIGATGATSASTSATKGSVFGAAATQKHNVTFASLASNNSSSTFAPTNSLTGAATGTTLPSSSKDRGNEGQPTVVCCAGPSRCEVGDNSCLNKHKCDICDKPMHAICGRRLPEGEGKVGFAYGQVCFVCDDKNNDGGTSTFTLSLLKDGQPILTGQVDGDSKIRKLFQDEPIELQDVLKHENLLQDTMAGIVVAEYAQVPSDLYRMMGTQKPYRWTPTDNVLPTDADSEDKEEASTAADGRHDRGSKTVKAFADLIAAMSSDPYQNSIKRASMIADLEQKHGAEVVNEILEEDAGGRRKRKRRTNNKRPATAAGTNTTETTTSQLRRSRRAKSPMTNSQEGAAATNKHKKQAPATKASSSVPKKMQSGSSATASKSVQANDLQGTVRKKEKKVAKGAGKGSSASKLPVEEDNDECVDIATTDDEKDDDSDYSDEGEDIADEAIAASQPKRRRNEAEDQGTFQENNMSARGVRIMGTHPMAERQLMDAKCVRALTQTRPAMEMLQKMTTPESKYLNMNPEDHPRYHSEKHYPNVIVGEFILTQLKPNEDGSNGSGGHFLPRPELHFQVGSNYNQRKLEGFLKDDTLQVIAHSNFDSFVGALRSESAKNKAPPSAGRDSASRERKSSNSKGEESATRRKGKSSNSDDHLDISAAGDKSKSHHKKRKSSNGDGEESAPDPCDSPAARDKSKSSGKKRKSSNTDVEEPATGHIDSPSAHASLPKSRSSNSGEEGYRSENNGESDRDRKRGDGGSSRRRKQLIDSDQDRGRDRDLASPRGRPHRSRDTDSDGESDRFYRSNRRMGKGKHQSDSESDFDNSGKRECQSQRHRHRRRRSSQDRRRSRSNSRGRSRSPSMSDRRSSKSHSRRSLSQDFGRESSRARRRDYSSDYSEYSCDSRRDDSRRGGSHRRRR